MAVAMPKANPPNPPRFAGLALALLLPVVLLATLAAVALVRDWRAARAEAAARARELVVAAVERTAILLQSGSPVSPDATGVPSSLVDLWPDGFVIGRSNQLLSPAAGDWPPSPDPLDADNLPATLRIAWSAAHDAFIAGNWSNAVLRYDAFLGPAPDPTVPPGPVPHRRFLALAQFERALALERLGRVPDSIRSLAGLLGPAALATNATEAGIPIAHLAALRLLELTSETNPRMPRITGTEPSALPLLELTSGSAPPFGPMPSHGNDPVAALAQSPPSPYLATVVDQLRPRIARLDTAAPERQVLKKLLADLEHAETSRRLHAEALRARGTALPWPDLFWILEPDAAWLAVRRTPQPPPEPSPAAARPDSPRSYALLPEYLVRSQLPSIARELDRRGDFTAALVLAGRRLPVTPEADPTPDPAGQAPLATATRALAGGDPILATAVLTDARAFYGTQWRRTLLFGGLLAAALLAAGASVLATRRSLVRQHELNLQKSNFVSSVSHELRAPLGSIRLLAEGLERGTVPDDLRRHEYFRLISQETRRLGALVENVLDFSRIEQGRKRYELEPTDLRALVADTVKVFQPLALARHVEIACQLPPGTAPCEIIADGRALQQAQLNLLDNALKHSPPDSAIVVKLTLVPPPEAVPSEVHLSVRDQGPGIPPEDHHRIFEPFFRRGSELRRETQGVGIGLSIVRHIVDAHHGRVLVDSSPGAGACFTLVLPVQPPR